MKKGTDQLLEELYHAPLARSLARLARTCRRSENKLYHGTRSANAILQRDTLLYSRYGRPAVSLTRSPDVAGYFGVLPKDELDEGRGGVLILDHRVLRADYSIEPHNDFDGEPTHFLLDEMEESIWGRDIEDLSHYLVDVYVLDD